MITGLPRPALPRRAVLLAACTVALTSMTPAAAAADPGEPPAQPSCCAVPPRDEATADHVFGRWVVVEAGPGTPMRAGQRIEFRRDGAVTTNLGACRYAILRAELTIACSHETRRGHIEFVDDDKVVWRIDGAAPVTIMPAD